jgi:beta-lactamase class A
MHAQPLTDVTPEIRATLDAVDGSFAVAGRPLADTSQTVLLNAHESGHAASTMKVPIMVELYRQAHEGRFALDDSIRVKNDFRSIVDGSPYSLDPADDSHTALYDQLGERRPIRALMRDMITASSNLATNILIEHVGAESVTRTMERYGADGLQVRRGVEDMKAYRQGLNNTTTAHALMVLFERIARGEAVSEEASAEMVEILRAQEYNDMIPARLPDDVSVAHKTGWITGVRHDAGIVSVPDGPTYVLVLLSWDLEDPEAGVEALAQVSRIVYDAVRGE